MSEARRKGKFEPLGSLVGDLLRSLGLERRLREQGAVEAWEAVVGEAIAQHARASSIRDGVLFVEVDSSVWMQELALLRERIAERLNDHLGAAIVRRIVLAVERAPHAGGAAPEGEENE
jgi:predicted nucleic acid-binding Zn ribbon protein